MDHIHIDFLAICVAAFLYVVIDSFWYSKWLFGQVKTQRFWVRLLWNCLLGLGLAYFIAFFESVLFVTMVSDGMFVGLCIWLGFILPTLLAPQVFRSMTPKVFLIEGGAKLLSILVMSGVIGA